MTIRQIVVGKTEKLAIPAARAAGYSRPASEIEYSLGLARDGDGKVVVAVNQAEAREYAKSVGEGYRLPTAVHLQAMGERGYEDPAFDDNFARNDEKYAYWEWIDTGLLKPNGRNESRLMRGRMYNLRIVTEGGEKVGELWVPQNGIAREWSVFGIPSETAQGHKDGPETHFYFNANLDAIALCRGWSWGGSRAGCVDLDADWRLERGIDPRHGFRAVRGPLPKYEKLK